MLRCRKGLPRPLFPAGERYEQTTLLLADNHPNFLQKVENLLGETYEVVGRVGDGQALVEAARKL